MTEKRKRFLFLIIFLLVNSFGISENLRDEKKMNKICRKAKKTVKRKFWKMSLK